jgi:hypothetical protein
MQKAARDFTVKASQLFQTTLAPEGLHSFFHDVRQTSEVLSEPLSDADATVQSMPKASPAKWHLAHTTWFFEAMVLKPDVTTYTSFDEDSISSSTPVTRGWEPDNRDHAAE